MSDVEESYGKKGEKKKRKSKRDSAGTSATSSKKSRSYRDLADPSRPSYSAKRSKCGWLRCTGFRKKKSKSKVDQPVIGSEFREVQGDIPERSPEGRIHKRTQTPPPGSERAPQKDLSDGSKSAKRSKSSGSRCPGFRKKKSKSKVDQPSEFQEVQGDVPERSPEGRIHKRTQTPPPGSKRASQKDSSDGPKAAKRSKSGGSRCCKSKGKKKPKDKRKKGKEQLLGSTNQEVEEERSVSEGRIDKKLQTPRKVRPQDSELGGESEKTKGGFLATADTTRRKDRVIFLQAALKDFFIFLVFGVLVVFLIGYLTGPSSTSFAEVMDLVVDSKFNSSNGYLLTFRRIRIIDQIWEFLGSVLMQVIYNRDFITAMAQQALLKDGIKTFQENIFFGKPRIRQVRVRNDSCDIPESFKYGFSSCYSFFSTSNEDTNSFGTGSGTLWTYNNEEQTEESSYSGKISTYNAAGYYLDFPTSATEADNYLREMWNNTWIDHGTRAIFIDFTLYASPVNLFCVVKLVMELPPTGGVIPTADFGVGEFLKYETKHDYATFALELAVIFFLIYYLFEEIHEMIALKKRYFLTLWNIPDLSIVIIGFLAITVGIIRHIMSTDFVSKEIETIGEKHVNFDHIVSINRAYETILGFLSCAVWLKFLKFTSITQPGMFIILTYDKVKKELLGLTAMLLLLVFGFAMFAHVLFGSHVEQFNTIGKSMFTLISLFSGGLFFYRECNEARPFFAPIFFIMYIFLVILLFLNWFAAVLVHGMILAAKQQDAELEAEKYFITDMLHNFWFRLMVKFKRWEKVAEMRRKEALRRYKTDYEVVLVLLKKNGFQWLERILFMRRHQVAKDSHIDETAMDEIVADINGMNKLYVEVQEHEAIMAQVDKMKRRMEELDHSMADMVVKVDVLIDKMIFEESLEGKKAS